MAPWSLCLGLAVANGLFWFLVWYLERQYIRVHVVPQCTCTYICTYIHIYLDFQSATIHPLFWRRSIIVGTFEVYMYVFIDTYLIFFHTMWSSRSVDLLMAAICMAAGESAPSSF